MTYWSRAAQMVLGLGMNPVFVFLVPAERLSSSRTSWHRSMHWSQMKTPGPATSLRTWSRPLPQNEQRVYRRRSSLSFIDPSSRFLLGLCLSRRGRCRGIMAPQHLVRNAYALAADENTRTCYEPHTQLTLHLPAERALWLMPPHLAALPLSSE